MSKVHRVVIVGGGFGGMYAARHLRRKDIDVTLIDRRNFHLFQPLLYQVATGGLSPADIASPLRSVFKRQRNCRVLMGDVLAVDLTARRLDSSIGPLSYDFLVVAAGSANQYYGHNEWAHLAPGLKTIEDALEIRRRLYDAFEQAEVESDDARRRLLMTFVIVGAGPTGVELAGAVTEIAFDTLRQNFRRISAADARVILVEGAGRVLTAFPESLSKKAAASLRKTGVEIMTGTKVLALAPDCISVERSGITEKIAARTVLWAAGVAGSDLGRYLTAHRPELLDAIGRIAVERDMSLPGYPEVFVIGDLAAYTWQSGSPLPGLAPVAMQQGRYVGRVICRKLNGKSLPQFHYRDRGNLATIGRNAAVGSVGRFRFSGYFAWLTWLFVHLMYLVEYDNRVIVFVQWVWNYVTRNRGARLITPWAVPRRDPSRENMNDQE